MKDDLERRREAAEMAEAIRRFGERPEIRQIAEILRSNAESPQARELRDAMRAAAERPEMLALRRDLSRPLFYTTAEEPTVDRGSDTASKKPGVSEAQLRKFVFSLADGDATLAELRAQAESQFQFPRQMWRSVVSGLRAAGKVRKRGAPKLGERFNK